MKALLHKSYLPVIFLSLLILACFANICCHAGANNQSAGKQTIKSGAGLKTGFYYLSKVGEPGFKIKKDHSDEAYILNPVPFVSVDQMNGAQLKKFNTSGTVITDICLSFNNDGQTKLKNGSRDAINQQIGIVVAGHLIYVIQVSQPLTDSIMCIILMGYTESEMQGMLDKVNAKE